MQNVPRPNHFFLSILQKMEEGRWQSNGHCSGGGWIHPYQWDGDHISDLICADLHELDEEYTQGYNASVKLGMDDKYRKYYWNKIVWIVKY